MLRPIPSNDELSGFCPLSTEAINKYTEENPVGSLGVTAANAEIIRNIFGVPHLDGTCYNPRVSAVYENVGITIGIDDLTCYNQINGLQNTVVEPVPINNKTISSFG
jgi:hypothetical protein